MEPLVMNTRKLASRTVQNKWGIGGKHVPIELRIHVESSTREA